MVQCNLLMLAYFRLFVRLSYIPRCM